MLTAEHINKSKSNEKEVLSEQIRDKLAWEEIQNKLAWGETQRAAHCRLVVLEK